MLISYCGYVYEVASRQSSASYADTSYPEPDTRFINSYLSILDDFLFHGTEDEIKDFSGPAFFSGDAIAKSYANEGLIYKVKVRSNNPYVLCENVERMDRHNKGPLMSGTDLTLRDWVRDFLFKGAVSGDFDSKFKQFGVSCPVNLFSDGLDLSRCWSIVAKNMFRLGLDCLLYEDESMDKRIRGSACFLPESRGNVSIESVYNVDD